MNKQKPMATSIVKTDVVAKKNPARSRSILFLSLSRRPQASRLQPQVFCDPRMPGGWQAANESVLDSFAA